MIAAVILIATLLIPALCYVAGKKGLGPSAEAGLAGGAGAGLGIGWKFAGGFDGAGFVIESLFLVAGVLLTFGALNLGRKARAYQSQVRPEDFE